MRKTRYWTDEEITFLKLHYPINGIKFCALKLNRTNISIERKAKRLEIFRKDRKVPWTKEDKEFLIKNYPIHGISFCSKRLDRSEVSITIKAKILNLKKIKNVLTKNECILICKKYDNYSDFFKNEHFLYNFILNRGWLDELTKHMVRIKKKAIKWNKNDCIIEALKYNTIKEWHKKSRTSYRAAHINEWFEECSSHMIKLGSIQLRLIYSFEFSDNYVYVGLTCSPKKRNEYHYFNEKSPVYKHINKTNLIPKYNILTEFIDKNIARIEEGEILNNYINCGWNSLNTKKTGGLGGNCFIWNKINCIQEALKYKSRGEFGRKNNSAYGSARKNGWLDECCAHMELKLKKRNI